MKNILLVCAMLFALFNASVFAECDHQKCFYVSALGGAEFAGSEFLPRNSSLFEISFDSGFYAGGAIGYALNPALRTELEVSYRRSDVSRLIYGGDGNDFDDPYQNILRAVFDNPSDSHSSSILATVNVYVIFPVEGTAKPYIGCGMGYGHNEVSLFSNQVSFKEDAFAFQWIFGVNYPIQCRREVSMEYRYLCMSQLLNDHNLGLKLTQHF